MCANQLIDVTIGLRLSPDDEDAGADFIEHGMLNFSKVKTMNRVSPFVIEGTRDTCRCDVRCDVQVRRSRSTGWLTQYM